MTPEIWIRKDRFGGNVLSRLVVRLNGETVVIRLWDGSIDNSSYEELDDHFELFMNGNQLDDIIMEVNKE